MKYLTFLHDNWPSIVTGVTTVVLSARALVKLLPNPKAETYFEEIVDLLKHLGLVVTPPSTTPDPDVPAAPAPPIVVVSAPTVSATPAK